MKILSSPSPMNWEIERAILTEADTFPLSREDIACFERRIATTKQTRTPVARFTIAGPVAARAMMPSKIAA